MFHRLLLLLLLLRDVPVVLHRPVRRVRYVAAIRRHVLEAGCVVVVVGAGLVVAQANHVRNGRSVRLDFAHPLVAVAPIIAARPRPSGEAREIDRAEDKRQSPGLIMLALPVKVIGHVANVHDQVQRLLGGFQLKVRDRLPVEVALIAWAMRRRKQNKTKQNKATASDAVLSWQSPHRRLVDQLLHSPYTAITIGSSLSSVAASGIVFTENTADTPSARSPTT